MTSLEDELRATLRTKAQAMRVPERPALDRNVIEIRRPTGPRSLMAAACFALVLAGVVALAARQPDLETVPPAAPVVPDPTTTTVADVPPTVPIRAGVAELLKNFTAARIAGESAERYLDVSTTEVPLLYATSSGAPYERAEFDPVPGIEWPYGLTAYRIRLFAADAVVEQLFFLPADGGGLQYEFSGYATHIAPTVENGQPLAVPVDFYGGEVVLQAAHPWIFWIYPRGPFGRLVPEGEGVAPTTDGGERNDWDQFLVMAEPTVDGAGCESPSPADAEALAESIRSFAGLEATDPVAVSAGGIEALMMDVSLAAGANMTVVGDEQGNLCQNGLLSPLFDVDGTMAFERPGVVKGRATGERMRLYLFDMPAGSSMSTLAFAIVAPESTFERAVGTSAPIVASVQFNAS